MATKNIAFQNNTYAGKVLGGYMFTSLLSGDSVSRGLITVVQNVKKRTIMRNIFKTTKFQDPSCSFNGASGDISIEERYLDPVKYDVQEEYCFEDLIESWESEELRAGSLSDNEATKDLSDFVATRTVEEIAAMNEQLYWLGKASNANFTFTAAYLGMLPKIEAGANVTKISHGDKLTITGITAAAQAVITVADTSNIEVGDVLTVSGVVGMVEMNGLEPVVVAKTATTMTVGVDSTLFTAYVSGGEAWYINETNVIAVLSTIYSLIPDALRLKEDLKVYIPMHVQRAYSLAQAKAANGAGSYFIGEKVMDFLGQVLTVMPYWKANSILVARVSNLKLGVDLEGDGSTVRTTDLRDATGDDLVRIKVAMKSDVNYMLGNEILWYRPA